MTHLNNYTISDVVYSNIIADSNVSALHPTAQLTLVPDMGYHLNLGDFSIEHLPDGVSNITFSSAGDNLICTVTFDPSLIMPDANLDIPLCIIGSATYNKFTLAGKITPPDFIDPNVILDPYEEYVFSYSNNYEDNFLIYNITTSANEGFFISTPPIISQIRGDESLFSMSTVNSYTDDFLTSTTTTIMATQPLYDSFENNFSISRIGIANIYIPASLITSYNIDSAPIPVGGGTMPYYVYGDIGAMFNVELFDGSTHTTLVTGAVIDVTGIYELFISFPATSYPITYTITISGDLDPSFDTTGGQSSSVMLQQYPDITNAFDIAGYAGNRFYSTSLPSTFTNTWGALTYPLTYLPAYTTELNWTITSISGKPLVMLRPPTQLDFPVLIESSSLVISDVFADTAVPLLAVDGIVIGMNISWPGGNFVTTVVDIDSMTNIITLSDPITVLNGSTVTFSKVKANQIEIANIAVAFTPGSNSFIFTATALHHRYGIEGIKIDLDCQGFVAEDEGCGSGLSLYACEETTGGTVIVRSLDSTGSFVYTPLTPYGTTNIESVGYPIGNQIIATFISCV